MSDVEGPLQLFLRGFMARDVAEALASFDDSTPAETIRKVMQDRQLEFAGIRTAGIVAAWVASEDLCDDRRPLPFRPFDDLHLIADTASLNAVVEALNGATCLFVRCLGQVAGIIRRCDVQKPAMRMWLFGLVTITELRVTRLIDECCPDGAWRDYLSTGRLRKAHEIQEMRFRRGQKPSLLDCLQFADKGQIVARDEKLRALTPFSSRREVEDFVSSLQSLRDNLAHSQEIAGDWETIRNLAANLHRIVLGPAGRAR